MDGQNKKKRIDRMNRMGKRIFCCFFLILYILSIHVNSPVFLPCAPKTRPGGRGDGTMRGMGEKTIVNNRRAWHEYHILDKWEAGIVLQGTEVKSLRIKGAMQLKDSYIDFEKGEAFLVGAHISPYEMGNIFNHAPERPRKLLLHKREIAKLAARVAEKGLTVAPLSVYFKDGRVKVEIGLCQGKHTFDKRASIKERESKRELDRAMKTFRKG